MGIHRTACVCFNSSSTLISGCSLLHWFKSTMLNNCPVDATNWAIWANDDVFKSFMVGRVMFAICPSWPSSNVIVKRAREFCGKTEDKKTRTNERKKHNVKWLSWCRAILVVSIASIKENLNRYQFEIMEKPNENPIDFFFVCCRCFSYLLCDDVFDVHIMALTPWQRLMMWRLRRRLFHNLLNVILRWGRLLFFVCIVQNIDVRNE